MEPSPPYDPLSPEVMENPFPTYAKLRDKWPVQYYAGLANPYYILLRHEDVRDAEIDTTRYSAAYGVTAAWGEPSDMRQDGEIHQAFRLLVNARFSPKGLERYRDRIQAIIDGLIDTMTADGRTRAELYKQFCLALTARSTAILLGADQVDYDEMIYLTDRMFFFSWTLASEEQLLEIRTRTLNFVDSLLDRRVAMLEAAGITEATPEHVGTVVPDDLASDILCGKVWDRRATRDEARSMLSSLMAGGIDTTAHLISNCVWRLLEDRSRWETVSADPDKMIPILIEKSLRFDPPGLGLWRSTVKAFELHGVLIPARAKVQMSYGSANRDPRVFSDPETFRLDRPMSEMRKHMTFGAGPHMCIGQHLSRLETTLALRSFFKRTPDMRLDGPAERIENFGFWGRGKLPVAW